MPCYQEIDGKLVAFDDDQQWARPRPFADCGAGLVSTASDYLTFAEMLLAGGTHWGQRLLSAELVSAMTTDQLTPEQRKKAGPILDGRGWGFGLSIVEPLGAAPGPKGCGWNGGFGTAWANDPAEDLVAILLTQVLASPAGSSLENDSWTLIYEGLEAERDR